MDDYYQSQRVNNVLTRSCKNACLQGALMTIVNIIILLKAMTFPHAVSVGSFTCDCSYYEQDNIHWTCYIPRVWFLCSLFQCIIRLSILDRCGTETKFYSSLFENGNVFQSVLGVKGGLAILPLYNIKLCIQLKNSRNFQKFRK